MAYHQLTESNRQLISHLRKTGHGLADLLVFWVDIAARSIASAGAMPLSM